MCLMLGDGHLHSSHSEYSTEPEQHKIGAVFSTAAAVADVLIDCFHNGIFLIYLL